MSLFRVMDASRPPASVYPGCQGVIGYLGGNTPHVWSRDEWLRFQHLYQLGAWTGYLEADPAAHAIEAANAAEALGWIPFHGPEWRAILLDFENEGNRAWIEDFGGELQRRGFLCWPYLSLSVLGTDPFGYSVVLPDWNGVPNIPPYPNVIGHQFLGNVDFAGTQVDISVFESAVLGSFGEGPRPL